jgi:hypothetical protein
MSFQVISPTQRPDPPRKVPGFLDTLAPALGQGVGEGFNTGIKNSLHNAALERALGMVNPQMSALEQYMALSNENPEARNEVMGFLGGQQKSAHELEKIRYAHELKNASKAQESRLTPEQRSHVQSTFNRMGDIINSRKVGFHPVLKAGAPIYNAFSKDYQKNAAELKTLGLQIMGLTRKLENTGHLTEFQAQQVQDRIPNPNDSPEELQGKMRGIAQILDIDPGTFGMQGSDGANKEQQQTSQEPVRGMIIRNPKTGESKIWNGSRWQDYKGA